MAVSNSDTVILPDAAICLSDFQNASSRLTLVLCPPRTTDRFTIRDFISGLVLNSGFYTSRRRDWQRNRINGRRLGTARPFPLWRLHSGLQSSSVDQYSETPPEHLASTLAEATRRSVVTRNRNLCARVKPESGACPPRCSALECEASDNRHNLRGSTVLIYRAMGLGRALAGF
jgi:hypothetical protein